MNKALKLASYPLFYERIALEVPKIEDLLKRRPGRKPKYPRLPEDNVLENLEP